MWLEVATITLAVLWVGTLALGLAYAKKQRLAEVADAERHAKRDALIDHRFKELVRMLGDYRTGSIKMGEELHEMRAILRPLPDKVNQLEQRDPVSLSFLQAQRLVNMGASIDDLTQSCGLTQAEAELMSKLHEAPKLPRAKPRDMSREAPREMPREAPEAPSRRR